MSECRHEFVADHMSNNHLLRDEYIYLYCRRCGEAKRSTFKVENYEYIQENHAE